MHVVGDVALIENSNELAREETRFRVRERYIGSVTVNTKIKRLCRRLLRVLRTCIFSIETEYVDELVSFDPR